MLFQTLEPCESQGQIRIRDMRSAVQNEWQPDEIESQPTLAMNKIMVAMSDEMVKALEQQRKARKLESIPEAVRAVLGEYFKTKDKH